MDNARHTTKLYRVLFVCLGNICRSPAAEGIMREMAAQRGLADMVDVDSAGIGGWHVGQLPDSRMRRHAAARGYRLDSRARQFADGDFDRFDLIVAMDADNYACLSRRKPAGAAEQGSWAWPTTCARTPAATPFPTRTMAATPTSSLWSSCSRMPARGCSTSFHYRNKT